MSNISQRVGFDDERALASTSFDGTYNNIGTALQYNPVIIVFDNQTNVDVPISINGTSTWKTFSAGSALALDLKANHGIASTYEIDKGTQFSTNASVGTIGSFRISILYAR